MRMGEQIRENLEHIKIECKAYENERQDLINKINEKQEKENGMRERKRKIREKYGKRTNDEQIREINERDHNYNRE